MASPFLAGFGPGLLQGLQAFRQQQLANAELQSMRLQQSQREQEQKAAAAAFGSLASPEFRPGGEGTDMPLAGMASPNPVGAIPPSATAPTALLPWQGGGGYDTSMGSPAAGAGGGMGTAVGAGAPQTPRGGSGDFSIAAQRAALSRPPEPGAGNPGYVPFEEGMNGGNYLERVAQLSVLSALGPGYKVEMTPHGGTRPGARVEGTGGVSQHALGNAGDFQIYDPSGKPIPNKGEDVTGAYGKLAQEVRARLDPRLAGFFGWGGNFTTGPRNGPRDLMHFDLAGDRGGFGTLATEAGEAPSPRGTGNRAPAAAPQQEAARTGQVVQQNVNPIAAGRMSIIALAHQIDKANPGADPVVKYMALERIQKLLAPSEQIRLQLFMKQNDQTFQREMETMREKARALQHREDLQFRSEDRREQARLNNELITGRGNAAGWDVLEDTKTKQPYRFNKRTGEAFDFEGKPYTPSGAQRLQSGAAGARGGPTTLIMRKYMEEHPDASSDDLMRVNAKAQAAATIERNFGAGVEARKLNAINTAADHALLMREYGTALRNGDTQRLNQLKNRISEELGGADPSNFEVIKTFFGDEVATVLAQVGTGADREQAQQLFSRVKSPEQLEGAIEAAGRLLAGRLRSYEQQYSRGDESRKKAFENEILTPGSREWFGKFMGLSGQAPPAGGTRSPATSAQSIPVPSSLADKPDGYAVRKQGAPENEVWVKRGNQLILTPGAVVTPGG